MSRFEGWLVGRAWSTLARLAVGLLVGAVIGRWLGWPMLGLAAGALGAGGWAAAADARSAARLATWLHAHTDRSAPRDVGFWGELAYRIERLLRHRDRAVEAERERLRQFLNGIEASPNGVILLDPSDQIEWCSATAAQHFGLDPQRDRMQRLTNLVRAPAFVAHLQDGAFDETLDMASPVGHGRLQVTIRRYGEGSKLVLSQDVTERDRAESMRRDFVANVSHEIRTPLTVLSGFIETLNSLPLNEAERTRVQGLMQQQAARMQALVADLLTLAQLEGSPRPAADHWVDVGQLLHWVRADALALSAGRHGVVVKQEWGAELAGEQAELHSAFANLMTNAVRYTPEGGRIEARWYRRDDGCGVFAVADTGIGIAPEHIARLTERFYRVDGSRSRETGGTGLGLAIVKHVVQRHGGEILIDSEPGVGSTFKLIVPAARLRAIAPGNGQLHMPQAAQLEPGAQAGQASAVALAAQAVPVPPRAVRTRAQPPA